MFRKIRQHKKKLWLSILMLLVLSVYLYQESRPTVIFHTYKESGYLGKVSTFSGSIDKLYIKNHISQYRLPHIWNWDGKEEMATIKVISLKDIFGGRIRNKIRWI